MSNTHKPAADAQPDAETPEAPEAGTDPTDPTNDAQAGGQDADQLQQLQAAVAQLQQMFEQLQSAAPAVTEPDDADRDADAETPDDGSDDATDDGDGDSEPPAEPDAADDLPKEARLRKRAQDAEARATTAEGNLAALSAQHENLRNSVMADHIEQVHRVNPAAVQMTLADVPGQGFNDDGTIDHQAVADAVQTAQAKFGLAQKPRAMKPNPAQGTSGGGRQQRPVSFADSFRMR